MRIGLKMSAQVMKRLKSLMPSYSIGVAQLARQELHPITRHAASVKASSHLKEGSASTTWPTAARGDMIAKS